MIHFDGYNINFILIKIRMLKPERLIKRLVKRYFFCKPLCKIYGGTVDYYWQMVSQAARNKATVMHRLFGEWILARHIVPVCNNITIPIIPIEEACAVER